MEAKLIKTGNEYLLKDLKGEVLAITSGLKEGRMLSLKNCQAIERGYDLDELAKEELLKAEKRHKLLSPITYRDGVIKGFRKALEILGDKKFSEENIEEAFAFGQLNQLHNQKYFSGSKTYIQSLQQTEWDVEICNIMDCIGGNPCNGTSFECNHCTNIGEPKLDADGCLILKKI
jgi:hypothetical protein